MTYVDIPPRLPCAGKRKFAREAPRTYRCPHCGQYHPRGKQKSHKERRPCRSHT